MCLPASCITFLPIHAFTAQNTGFSDYLEKRLLVESLYQCQRIAKKGVVSVLYFSEHLETDTYPEDVARITTESIEWWREILTDVATEFVEYHDNLFIWR